MRPPFDRWDYAEIAASLRAMLATHESAARAVAASMHELPHGPVAVCKVERYERSLSSSRSLPFAEVFPTWGEFDAAIGEQDPGALEAALEILSRVDAASALPVVRAILETKPWTHMGLVAARALARIDDPAAVDLALTHLDVPYVSGAIGQSCCSAAVGPVLARLEASPVLAEGASSFDRRETSIVEDLLRYLGIHRVERAWATVARLYDEHPDEYVTLGSGHALIRYADERSFAHLLRSLDSAVQRRRFFAVRAAFRRDPARVVETLGGLEALRDTAKAEIVSELFQEATRASDGKIADPSILELALHWAKDRGVKDVAKWVLDAFGKEAVAAAKKRLRLPKAPKKLSRPSDREIAEIRTRIEAARRNVERLEVELRALGYVFRAARPVPKRAGRATTVAGIEKALGGPLPVSLKLALELLGGCDFTGRFPDQPPELQTDAFFLVEPKLALEQAIDEADAETQLSLAIAPDAVGKAGFSGGQEVMLVPARSPDEKLDARVIGVPGEPLFLDRLHETFRWGGFPGLAGATGALSAKVQRLAASCEPV